MPRHGPAAIVCPVYLTEHILTTVDPVRTEWVDDSLDSLPAGAPGALVGRPLGGSPGVAYALWPQPVNGGLELLDAIRGPAPVPARYARLTAFDGPRDDARATAEELSHQGIAAAVPGFAGWVCLLRARAVDNGVVVLVLAESVAAIQTAQRQVLTPPLPPDEDPLLAIATDQQRGGQPVCVH